VARIHSAASCHPKVLNVLGAVWPERTSKLRVAGSIPAGRTIADVLLQDGTNVNHQLVKDGWCWWYKRYAPRDAELEKLETEA
jgi:endonuclease YncB( thermonuclease family)